MLDGVEFGGSGDVCERRKLEDVSKALFSCCEMGGDKASAGKSCESKFIWIG